MNKEVISIAPEDDITDIVSRVKNSDQRIIALIPPQPIGILRSAVNIKLIARIAEESRKVPVLVTSDPALLKLAYENHIPVAESLTSRPSVPTEEDLNALESDPEKERKITEDFVGEPRSFDEVVDSDVEKEINKSDEEEKPEGKNEEKQDEGSQSWFSRNKKPAIISGSALILVVLFFVWALVFAPFVSATLSIHTSSNNFSESASFTTKEAEEDSRSGKFYLAEEKLEYESKVNYTATGQKNVGDKASGKVTVSIFFLADESHSVTIPKGTEFIRGGKKFLSNAEAKISFDDKSTICENGGGTTSEVSIIVKNGCKVSGEIEVTAIEPGESYNLSEGEVKIQDGLFSENFIKSVSTFNYSAFTGGTTKMVTIVQQSDIDSVKDALESMKDSDGKQKLAEKISETVIPIWNSYKTNSSAPEPSVKAGEEATDKSLVLSMKTYYTVYTIDKVRVEEFINEKATLASDQKIYSIGEPFVEYFNGADGVYSGKLKTTYETGPRITETEVREKIDGKKIGEAQSLLKSINGVSNVKIDASFFWVTRVPSDPNKVSIEIKNEE